MAKVLVVGGAGYVGSATVAWLEDMGHETWVLDDLSTGHRECLIHHRFIEARCGDRDTVLPLLMRERFDSIMHFAARSIVSEGERKRDEYYENNVLQTKSLLDAMETAGIRSFIFSSTCAVFGDPGDSPIREDLQKRPLNYYGETKLAVETLLAERAAQGRLRAIALRYFNASGAEPKLRVGEWHDPETHLIPSVLCALSEGRPLSVFGTDYPTPDGTCVRDYISVWDLAAAHGAAMKRTLEADGLSFEAFNLGTERGSSVREVIDVCADVTGKPAQIQDLPRRPGDSPRLVADSALAREVLGFKPASDLRAIVRSAWAWEQIRAQLSHK